MAEMTPIIMELRGLWRMKLGTWFIRIFGWRVIALVQKGMFDPAYRVNGGKWERIRLRDEMIIMRSQSSG